MGCRSLISEVWKQFDENPITHSAAHHVMAIAELREEHGYARVSDVAKTLNITRGSVSLTLKTLKQRGLVEEDENRFLLLSTVGEALAAGIRGKQFLTQKFFVEVLGVPEEQARVDSCKIEHLVSHETAKKLTGFLRYIESGDPRADEFMLGWRGFSQPCDHDPNMCPACFHDCLTTICEAPK